MLMPETVKESMSNLDLQKFEMKMEEFETDSGRLIIKQSGDMNGCVSINVFWDTKNIGRVVLRDHDNENGGGVVNVYFKPCKDVNIDIKPSQKSRSRDYGKHEAIPTDEHDLMEDDDHHVTQNDIVYNRKCFNSCGNCVVL